MSKKKKRAKLQKKAPIKKKAQKSIFSFLKNDTFLFIKHLVLGILIVIACVVLTKSGAQYHWYYNSLHKTNLQYAFGEKGDFNETQKNEIKLGFNYKYLEHIRMNTPENAIILLPDEDIFLKENSEAKFTNYITRKGYASYFVYPRKLVYENERESSELYTQATHVGIVNQWGYEKLNYQVANRANYTVLPINQM